MNSGNEVEVQNQDFIVRIGMTGSPSPESDARVQSHKFKSRSSNPASPKTGFFIQEPAARIPREGVHSSKDRKLKPRIQSYFSKARGASQGFDQVRSSTQESKHRNLMKFNQNQKFKARDPTPGPSKAGVPTRNLQRGCHIKESMHLKPGMSKQERSPRIQSYI